MDNEAIEESMSSASTCNTRCNIIHNDRSTNYGWSQRDNIDINDYGNLDLLALGYQIEKPEQKSFGIRTSQTISTPKELNNKVDMSLNEAKDFIECKENTKAFCHVTMDAIIKLKDSTKKLLCLLEEIQSKTHSKNLIPDDTPKLTNIEKSIAFSNSPSSVTDAIGASALKQLEFQMKTLDAIYVQDEDDDCSVYKKITRKCQCLNQTEYNDFVIHFNEDIKHFTNSTLGEIIKNMRILKKFLYMGCGYTKNALMFLNEGLSESTHHEKIEIIQGCSYADICNVFDEHSIVIICISWPCKYPYYGDSVTQALTAGLLYKIAQIEDGRRYLKFSSKITNDMKKVLRKKASKLEFDTLDSLNSTLNLLNPPMAQHLNVTYYCKPINEDLGKKTLNALMEYRQYMTKDEVFTHLDLLTDLSKSNNGKFELTSHLPVMLNLFKHLLIEYDNSEMNIIITNILNNVVSKNMVKDKGLVAPKSVIIADTATETITTKNEINQVPQKKNNVRNINKSKIGLGASPNKHKRQSDRKIQPEWESSPLLSKSRKFNKKSSWLNIIPDYIIN